MVSVKNEINEVLLNAVSDLENRLDESRTILSDIQEKMDSKVSEAKEYKVQVDDAKENIIRLEDEINSLENDLTELKEKYSKKNLVAVIDAGTREINAEIKKKQDEIQIHKNKIAELTNRARSIKDLLMNLKKDKKIKEERLKELENCTNYYKVRLTEVVKFAEEHDDLDDYFVSFDEEEPSVSVNVFDDIAGIEETEEKEETNIFDKVQEEISIEDAEEVFNDVINSDEDDEVESDSETEINLIENNSLSEEIDEESTEQEETIEETVEEETIETNEEVEEIDFDDATEATSEIEDTENIDIEGTTELKIDDLLNAVKEPLSMIKEETKEESALEKLDGINKTIDREFENVFGQDINEPIKTVDFFGNEYKEDVNNEDDIVNKLTSIGLDYYSFTEEDKNLIKSNFNEQVISELVNVLKTNKIQLDNVYVDAKILSGIAPAELSDIVTKLLNAGQSADAIGYVLDKLPLVDSKLLDVTINNYGDYIKNVDIVDIIFKSLKGDK